MLYFVARGSIEFTRGERVTAIIGLLTNISFVIVSLSQCMQQNVLPDCARCAIWNPVIF